MLGKMLNDNVRRCKHVKTNGIRCGSPAIRDHDCCYFHRQAALDFPRRKSVATVAEPVIDLALIDDADGIHYAIMQVMRGVLNGTITTKQSGQILYALQLLSANFKQTSFHRQKEDEYRKSNLNAYELWDKMGVEIEDRKREKRIAELKKLERTCSKCRTQVDSPEALAPPIPPEPSANPVAPPPREKQWWEIKACAEESSDRKARALNAKDAEDAKGAGDRKSKLEGIVVMREKDPPFAARRMGHPTGLGMTKLTRI